MFRVLGSMGSTLLNAMTTRCADTAPKETAIRHLAPAWRRGVKQSISINLGKNQIQPIPKIGHYKQGSRFLPSAWVRVLHGKHAGRRATLVSLTSKMAYIRLGGEQKLTRVMQSSLEGENYWPTMPPVPPRRSLRIANQS